MNEYLIKYEAPPISEITKEKTISDANTIFDALEEFKRTTDGLYDIFSIELI